MQPHRATLSLGLLAAVGVGLFYTFSISSAIPLLKVIFADHETLADAMDRMEAGRRLGASLPPDVPDSPLGVHVLQASTNSPNARVLTPATRIVAIDGERGNTYELIRSLANRPAGAVELALVSAEDEERTVTATLSAERTWWTWIRSLANLLPAQRDPQTRLWTLTLVMAALVVVSILGGLCRFANEGLVNTAVQRAMHGLRTQMAGHVLRMPMSWHSSHPPGDALSRFTSDVGKVEVGVSTLFGKVIREPLKAMGVLTLTLLIDWRLLVVALVGLPIGAIVLRTFGRLVKRAQRRVSDSWGLLLDHLGERLAGIRVVKAYGMEEAERRRFESEDLNLTRAQTHIELVDAATNPALEVLAMLAVAAFVIYGGSRVFQGLLEPHLFFAAVICLGGILDPVRKMGNVYNRLQAADASAGRLFEIIDAPTEPVGAKPATPTERRLHTLEFRDVWFAYSGAPNRHVLQGVNLTIPGGSVAAIVGPNGSGKTTLVALMLRFFEPTRGAIFLDGVNIATLPLDDLRRRFGLVTQDSVVFSDTTAANLAYGEPNADMARIRDAARLAHVDDFVRGGLRGYDTPITARTLSGGQRQRIALARAVLRDPPILVLDEATSQVDTESERKIQEALDALSHDRTTIIIAHRFSTIARADMTVVLDQGRVVGVGKHAELVESCPIYETLCHTQFAPA